MTRSGATPPPSLSPSTRLSHTSLGFLIRTIALAASGPEGGKTIAKCNAAVYKSKGGSCADGDGSGCGWGTYHFQERAQRNMFVIALSQIFRALTHTPPSFSPQTTRSLQVPLHRRQNEIAVQGELQQPLGEWLVAWQRAQGLPRHLRRVGPQGRRPEEDCLHKEVLEQVATLCESEVRPL